MSGPDGIADFDRTLIAAAFTLAAEQGWRRVSVAAAARAAGLGMAEARARFPSRGSILLRFGVLADQAALSDLPPQDDPAPVHERLFDMLMRRIDVLQSHRPGMLALLSALPADPPSALLLGVATRRSMRWLLEGAGVSARGITGEWRMRGLLGVWLWTVRAWRQDESEDLSATMAALDQALRRAGRAAEWLDGLCAGRRKTVAPADGEAATGTAATGTAATAETTENAPPALGSDASAEPE